MLSLYFIYHFLQAIASILKYMWVCFCLLTFLFIVCLTNRSLCGNTRMVLGATYRFSLIHNIVLSFKKVILAIWFVIVNMVKVKKDLESNCLFPWYVFQFNLSFSVSFLRSKFRYPLPSNIQDHGLLLDSIRARLSSNHYSRHFRRDVITCRENRFKIQRKGGNY